MIWWILFIVFIFSSLTSLGANSFPCGLMLCLILSHPMRGLGPLGTVVGPDSALSFYVLNSAPQTTPVFLFSKYLFFSLLI